MRRLEPLDAELAAGARVANDPGLCDSARGLRLHMAGLLRAKGDGSKLDGYVRTGEDQLATPYFRCRRPWTKSFSPKKGDLQLLDGRALEDLNAIPTPTTTADYMSAA